MPLRDRPDLFRNFRHTSTHRRAWSARGTSTKYENAAQSSKFSHSTRMDNSWAGDFEQNSSKPPAPPEPPRPPPRDVNPFGQPPTPVAAENGGGGGGAGGGSGGHGHFSSTEPPTPTSPPPVPARNTTATAAAAAPAEAPAGAPAAEVAVENGSAGHDESLTPPPTSPPPPPLPPKSSPRSNSGSVVPGGQASDGAWGGGGGSASPTTDARLTGRRKGAKKRQLPVGCHNVLVACLFVMTRLVCDRACQVPGTAVLRLLPTTIVYFAHEVPGLYDTSAYEYLYVRTTIFVVHMVHNEHRNSTRQRSSRYRWGRCRNIQ